MKRFFKIVIIPLIMLFLTAERCNETTEKARQDMLLNYQKEEIRLKFGSDFLDESSLFAYETAAKQKLTDFADLFRILVDTSLQLTFREKAGEMILSSFHSDSIRVKLAFDPVDISNDISIKNLVRSGLNNRLLQSRFIIDSVRVEEPFRRINEESYKATLNFSQKSEKNSNHLNSGFVIQKNIEVVINKADKIFGPDTLSVWTLYLGKIN